MATIKEQTEKTERLKTSLDNKVDSIGNIINTKVKEKPTTLTQVEDVLSRKMLGIGDTIKYPNFKIDNEPKMLWDYNKYNFKKFYTKAAFDADGSIYVINDHIAKLANNGDSIWSDTSRNNFFYSAICVPKEGNICITGRTTRVSGDDVGMIYTRDGAIVATFKTSGNVDSIDCDDSGNFYIGTSQNVKPSSQVIKVDNAGNVIWESQGFKWRIFGVAVDSNGFVYACENNSGIYKIDPSGKKIKKVNAGDLVSPTLVTVNSKGNLLVVCYAREQWGYVLIELDSELNELKRSNIFPSIMKSLKTDKMDNIYISIGGTTIAKLREDFSNVFSYYMPSYNNAQAYIDVGAGNQLCCCNVFLRKITNPTGDVIITNLESER